MAARWIDVTVPLRDGMAHWPDNPPVRITRLADMQRGDDADGGLAGRPFGHPYGAPRISFRWPGDGCHALKNLYSVPRVDPSVAQGKSLYAEFACAGCHRIHGEGGALGPDLSFVGDARPEREWHLKHFRDPQSVSPGSIMPKYPLTDRQLDDLTNYMLTLRRVT